DTAVNAVGHVPDFPNPVTFPWVAYHYSLHADVFQGDVELLGFRDGNVAVVLTVHQKRRRPDRADKTKWRALPEPVHQVLLMRLDTVSHVNVLIVIGPVVVRNRIGDASGRGGR